MKRFNITTCKVYQSQGQEKKYWPQVGTMIYFPAGNGKAEGYRIELNMFPGLQLYVFEQKPQNRDIGHEHEETTIDADSGDVRPAVKGVASVDRTKAKVGSTGIEYPTEEINPEDIPF